MSSRLVCYYNQPNTNFYFHYKNTLFCSTLGLTDDMQMAEYRHFLNSMLYKENAVYTWRRGSIVYMPRKNTLIFHFKRSTMTFEMPSEQEHSFMYGLLTNFLYCAENTKDALLY